MSNPSDAPRTEPVSTPIEQRIAEIERYVSNGFGNPSFNGEVRWLIAELRSVHVDLAASRANADRWMEQYGALVAERDAWQEWAEHQEWCAHCAEGSPDDCGKDGGQLKQRARSFSIPPTP